MTPTRRPIAITVIATLTVIVGVAVTVPVVNHVASGGEASARVVGFPVVLAVLAVGFSVLAVLAWRSYATRDISRPSGEVAPPDRIPSSAHRPGDRLHYGDRVDEPGEATWPRS